MTDTDPHARRPSTTRRLVAGSVIATAGLLGVLAGCSSSGPGPDSGATTPTSTAATTTVTTRPEDRTQPSTSRAPNTDTDSGGATGYAPGGGDLRNEDDPLVGS